MRGQHRFTRRDDRGDRRSRSKCVLTPSTACGAARTRAAQKKSSSLVVAVIERAHPNGIVRRRSAARLLSLGDRLLSLRRPCFELCVCLFAHAHGNVALVLKGAPATPKPRSRPASLSIDRPPSQPCARSRGSFTLKWRETRPVLITACCLRRKHPRFTPLPFSSMAMRGKMARGGTIIA